QSVLLVVGRRTRISSPFPYTTLFRSRGQSRASKAVQAAGVRTTATVIDHVAVEMREVGATANSQPVKDKHQYIIADFEYDPRRIVRIAALRRRLPRAANSCRSTTYRRNSTTPNCTSQRWRFSGRWLWSPRAWRS